MPHLANHYITPEQQEAFDSLPERARKNLLEVLSDQIKTDLSLRFFHLSARDLQTIVNFLPLTNVAWLDLIENSIGAEGARIIATAKQIKVLLLEKNNIGKRGAIALAENTTIKDLSIVDDDIGLNGLTALAANKTLISLNVSHNNLGPGAATILASNNTLYQMNLLNTNIDERAKELTKCKNLQRLWLTGSRMHYKDAIALANSPSIEKLFISDNGLDALCRPIIREKLVARQYTAPRAAQHSLFWLSAKAEAKREKRTGVEKSKVKFLQDAVDAAKSFVP